MNDDIRRLRADLAASRVRRLASDRMAEIGKRGQARRRELGLTVGGLAARLGCTRERVYNLECYGAGMIATVERWAVALEMDPGELAFGVPKVSLAQSIARATLPFSARRVR